MKKLISLFLACLIALPAQADTTISSGLTLVVPAQASRNWGTKFLNTFATPISAHDHTGGGKGLNISTSAIAASAVTGAKIRLANDEYLRARNAANSADLDILKMSSSNKLRFDSSIIDATTRTDLGVAKSGANSDITSLNTGTIGISSNNVATVTSDGSDNSFVNLGHITNARGAFLTLYGNEAAGGPGNVNITAGNVSGGLIIVETPGAEPIKLRTSATDRWWIEAAGNLTPRTDDTYSIGSSSLGLNNIYVARRTYTPTLTVSAGSTVTSSSTTFARYTRYGKDVLMKLNVTVTPGTLDSAVIGITVPSASAAGGTQGGECLCLTGGTTYLSCNWAMAASTAGFQVFKSTSWTSGTSVNIMCNILYEET